MSDRDIEAFREAQQRVGQMRQESRLTTADAARDALLHQIRRVLDNPTRESLRRAKDDRAYAAKGYGSALDHSQRWIAESVRRYVGALSAEAAANRAEAREARELLAALLRIHDQEPAGSKTPTERDTQEVQP